MKTRHMHFNINTKIYVCVLWFYFANFFFHLLFVQYSVYKNQRSLDDSM